MRALFERALCWAFGHGPWSEPIMGVVHEGELWRAKRCGCCGEYQLLEVVG